MPGRAGDCFGDGANGEFDSLPGLNSFAEALRVNSLADGLRPDDFSAVEVVVAEATVAGVAVVDTTETDEVVVMSEVILEHSVLASASFGFDSAS